MKPSPAPLENPGLHQYERPVSVPGVHRLYFTKRVFDPENETFADALKRSGLSLPTKAIVFLDEGLTSKWPGLSDEVTRYGEVHPELISLRSVETLPGGERIKNSSEVLETVLASIDREGICRKSIVVAVGGGALLDVVGYAAAIAHRGIGLIRFPTTTLAQGDSGVGVKNGINAFGKKNFLGTFDIPLAVINDTRLLSTLSPKDWRCGFSEAVKVGLIKDRAFFERIREDVGLIGARSMDRAVPIIRRSAELHYLHIVEGGDPFEKTFARPLDFGHWAAHKIEQMTNYEVRHGEAVAIGIALDSIYSHLVGLLSRSSLETVLACLKDLGFSLFHPSMRDEELLFAGIEEFRQHLGGELAIPLLEEIGASVTADDIELGRMSEAVASLAALG